MTVTRWPHASQREICPKRFVPVPPPWGCVQSRSVSTRMWSGHELSMRQSTLPNPEEADPPREPLLWRPMTGCRRLAPVLATAVLAVAAAPARAQSGAGDDQYTDPFGSGSTTTKSHKSTSSSTTQKQSSKSQTGPPLSNQPPVSSGSGTSPTSTGSTSTTPTATSAPAAPSVGELPRTGFEVPG